MKFGLGLFALRDVVADADVTRYLSRGVEDRINRDAGDQLFAVLANVRPLPLFGLTAAREFDEHLVALNRAPELSAQNPSAGFDFGCQVPDSRSLFSDHFLGGITQHPFRAVIE